MKLTDLTPFLEQCRSDLKASEADFAERRENVNASLLKEREVTRTWKNLTADLVPVYKAFFDYYTDAKNMQPSMFVIDPLVGGESLAKGKWRGAFVFESYQGDVLLLSQTLRYGFIEKLVTGTTVDYSEARLIDTQWFNGDGKAGENSSKEDYNVIQWKGVSPVKSKEIVESLKALDYDAFNPIVNGNDLGPQKRLNVIAIEEQDGSHTIRMLVANPTLHYEAYRSAETNAETKIEYYYGIPTNAVPSILTLHKSEGATAFIANRPRAEGLSDITISYPKFSTLDTDGGVLNLGGMEYTSEWNAFYREWTVVHMGLKKADSDSVVLTEPPEGRTETLRRSFDGDRWNIFIRVRVAFLAETDQHVVSERHDGRTIKQRRAESVPSSNPPAWTIEPSSLNVGDGVEFQRALNEYKQARVSRTDHAQEEKVFPSEGFFTHSTIGGTVYKRFYFGIAPSNLSDRMQTFDTYDETHSVSARPQFDPVTGTFNLIMVATPLSGGGGSSSRQSWEPYESSKNIGILQTRMGKNGKRQRRVLPATHFFKGSDDEDNVTVVSGLSDPPNYSSSFRVEARGRFFHYEAIHITNFNIAWSDDEGS